MSLVVCTRNRYQKLQQTLDYIRQLEFDRDWELIVVDNGSTDSTSRVVGEFAAAVPFRVTLVEEPEPGVARARNSGLARAQGAIIACIDDDCYPERDYLDQVWKVFQDPDIDFIGGRILLYDPDDAAATIRTDLNEERIPPRSFIMAGTIQGANLAFRRRVFERIGGYDPRFGPGSPIGSGDDIEFVARASAAGFGGGYFPGPVVYHHHGRKPGHQITARFREYDIGRGAYYARFLLQRRTAALYARKWLKLAIKQPRRRRRIPGELRGALRYGKVRLMEVVRALTSRGP